MNYHSLFFPFNRGSIIIGLLAVVLGACDTSESEPVYLGYEYFGHEEGKWVIYQVDSTVYDDFLNEVFHYNYQVMEVNRNFYEDSQGMERLRIERFYRSDEQHPWAVKNVWTSTLQNQRALKTEENTTFVKLAFPVRENLSWNGNQFNNKPSQLYRITHVHEPLQIGTFTFDSTARVLQNEFFTLIGEEFQYEVFATKVGMIEKKYLSLEKEVDGTILRGVDYSYEIVDYGFD